MSLSDPKFTVRCATPADSTAIAAIYSTEVMHGTATFELDPPDSTEIARRLAAAGDGGYPFLVADGHAGIVGYAYLAAFRSRPAFQATAENSVYVARDTQGQGVGRLLLRSLLDAAAATGRFHRIVAVIGDPEAQAASIALHRSAGFANAGRLSETGLKFGRWLDVVLMERAV